MSPKLVLNSQLAEAAIALLIFLLYLSSVGLQMWVTKPSEKVTLGCYVFHYG